MYLPSAFREDALDVQHDFIRAHPLGVVMTAGPGGLMANHIPCLLYPEGEHGVLRLHVARANPQLAELASGAECLVAFHGPQAYVTPSWYATKAETHKVVPTWNFVAVHAWGKPVIQDDPAWLRAQLEALTESQERPASCPGAWRTRRPISSPRRCAPSWASRFPSRASKASGKPARTAPRRSAGRGARPGGRGDAVMAGLVARRGGLG